MMRRQETIRDRIAPFASFGYGVLVGGIALAGTESMLHQSLPSIFFAGTTGVLSYVYATGLAHSTGRLAGDYMRYLRDHDRQIPEPSLRRTLVVNGVNLGLASVIGAATGFQTHAGLEVLHAPDWVQFAGPFILGALPIASSMRVNYVHDELERGAHN